MGGRSSMYPDREPSMPRAVSVSSTVGVALIGAGAIGSFHAETLAHRLRGAHLAGIADVGPGKAEAVAAAVGCDRWTTDYRELLDDANVHAVVIATPSAYHAEAVEATARAGKAVFCEKPIADTLEQADRAISAADLAGVPLQIGFQRRCDVGFRRAHELAASGKLGSIQLLRSITRDPVLEMASARPTWSLFRDTLVHDFDVLRWLCGSEPTTMFAMASSLSEPNASAGTPDTAIVAVSFQSGALAVADGSFQAVYGYDVRAEVFGTGGMATIGDGRRSGTVIHTREGSLSERVFWYLDLFGAAYSAELADFVTCVRTGTRPACTGEDGRAALLMALCAIRSAETGAPVAVASIDPRTPCAD